MSILRRDDTVTNTLGNAITGAQVYYLGPQPADVDTLTPLLPVYSDTSGTPTTNPQTTDGFGHAVAYLDDGALFTCVYVYPNGTKVVYPDQFVGSSSGGPVPFGAIPTGTVDGNNRVFTIPRVLTQAFVWLNYTLGPGLGYTLVPNGGGMTLTYATAPAPASGGNPADFIYVQGF